MCTTIELNTNESSRFFGRNMDIEFEFDAKIVLVQRGFSSKHHLNHIAFTSKYAVLGTATIIENYPLFADGFNETGLVCAALNFPYYCEYSAPSQTKENNVPVYDVLLWILSSFSRVSEVKEAFIQKKIVDIPFSDTIPNTTLHWCVHDQFECIVIECTKHGLQIHQNPVGVLTNSPSFDCHLSNLSQYEHLSPKQSPPNNSLPYIGQGCGLVGLPGDFSSPSRFIRGCLLKSCSETVSQGLAQTFHILDNLAMVKGAVITPQNKSDFTVYSCCFDLSNQIYYYKTYENPHLHGVLMPKDSLDGGELLISNFIVKDDIPIQSFDVNILA